MYHIHFDICSLFHLCYFCYFLKDYLLIFLTSTKYLKFAHPNLELFSFYLLHFLKQIFFLANYQTPDHDCIGFILFTIYLFTLTKP